MKPLFFGENTVPSPIHASDTLKGMLQSLIKEGCSISQLFYKALFASRYLNPKMKFNYISHREKQGMLSYCPFGKEQAITEDGKWAREGRQEIKPVKLVKDLLHPRLIAKFKDHQLAEFATKFKAFEEGSSVKFELVPVQDAYNTENAYNGQTFGSCMANKPVGEFYEKFNVKALVARHRSGKLLGRALLWEDAEITMSDGTVMTVQFLDRIYAYNEAVTELYHQWVREHKIWKKERQNADCASSVISPSGTTYDVTIRVNCVEGSSLKTDMFFPYMDTLSMSDTYTNVCNRRNANDGGYKILYRHTDGCRRVDVDPDYVEPVPEPVTVSEVRRSYGDLSDLLETFQYVTSSDNRYDTTFNVNLSNLL